MKIKWCQKYRVNWLRNGDNNTKFFLSYANNRISSNLIRSLFINGSECTNLQSIEEHIIQHFQALYPKNQQRRYWSTEWIGKSLTLEKATWLERTFLLDEIKEAVFSMALDRAAKPDGFSMGFFQRC